MLKYVKKRRNYSKPFKLVAVVGYFQDLKNEEQRKICLEKIYSSSYV